MITSQIIAMIKAGQPAPFKTEVKGFTRAPTAEPIPINGRAGIKEAISPNKTVRTTTGFPQMR